MNIAQKIDAMDITPLQKRKLKQMLKRLIIKAQPGANGHAYMWLNLWYANRQALSTSGMVPTFEGCISNGITEYKANLKSLVFGDSTVWKKDHREQITV